ncbi:MAG: hypothetical protein NXY57DRAFT_1045023, partial [Lentinula lateritia]
MFIPTVNTELSMTRDSAQSSEKVSQNEYDALCQAYIDLEKSLENARTNIKALEDAIEACNKCTFVLSGSTASTVHVHLKSSSPSNAFCLRVDELNGRHGRHLCKDAEISEQRGVDAREKENAALRIFLVTRASASTRSTYQPTSSLSL